MLERLSSQAGWRISFAGNAEEAVEQFRVMEVSIVVYDREVNPAGWRQAIRLLCDESPQPYLILLSKTSDRNLWEELERLGGSDILKTPLDAGLAMRAVNRGWSLWRSQQRLRCAPPRM